VVVEFDVADRCRAEVASLAATYLVRLGSNELRDAGAQSIAWADGQAGDGALTLESDAGATLALAEAGRRCARAQALALLEPGSFTHRLRYRWRWATTAGEDPSRTR
jgi:triphosphoribosyl-dephospho-CoA synthetase